jgi:ubiquinone/menaquinone biosynthesis C-methylase UbiE
MPDSIDGTPETFKSFEHRGWCRVARCYDTAFGAATSQSIPAMLDAVAAGPGKRVLDVACGPGYVAAEAAARGASVLGVDFASDMVQLARSKWPTLEFLEGDAEQLTLPGAAFDAVVMNFGILHLADPDAAVARAMALLAPGGTFAFTVWMPPPQTTPFAIVLESVEKFGQLNIGVPPGPPMFRFAEMHETRRVLEAFGFARIEFRPLPIALSLTDPDTLFQIMLEGGVRTSGLLKAQSASALEAIRAHMRTRVLEYRDATSPQPAYRLPMPAILITATRPAK